MVGYSRELVFDFAIAIASFVRTADIGDRRREWLLLYRGLCQEWADHVILCSFFT
jgi:hypothetical protein